MPSPVTIPAIGNTWNRSNVPSDAYLELGSATQPPGLGSARMLFSVVLPIVPTVADLRLVDVTLYPDDFQINLAGYYAPGDGGGGPNRIRVSGSPGTYVDNGGSVIVPTGGDGSVAWIWQYSGPLNARWFGAKGDATANDRTAIQAAIDAIPNAGGQVFLPRGRYKCNTSLNVLYSASKRGVEIVGEGWATELINGGTGNVITIGNDATNFYNSSVQLKNFRISDGATGDKGIAIVNAGAVIGMNVLVEGHATGLHLEGAITNAFYSCGFSSNAVGVRFLKHASSTNKPNLNRFYSCSTDSNTSFAVHMTDGENNTLDGLSVQGNVEGIKLDGDCKGVSIVRSWFESNTGTNAILCDIISAGLPVDTLIMGNTFFDAAVQNYINLNYAYRANIIGNFSSNAALNKVLICAGGGNTIDVMILNNGFDSAMIQDDSLTTTKLVDGNVTVGNNKGVFGKDTLGAAKIGMFFGNDNNLYFGPSFALAIELGATPRIGFYGAAPGNKPNVTGAKAGNLALGSLVSGLAAIGLITDGTAP